MADRESLWKVMDRAYTELFETITGPDDKEDIAPETGYAAEIRAIADWLVPEDPMVVEGGRTYEQNWLAAERERLCNLLLAEADKAEIKDGITQDALL